jgi:hypothetical protein
MAGRFKHGKKVKAAFEGWCVQLLVSAYQEAIINNSIKIEWKENDITEHLREYMDHNQLRLTKHISLSVEYRLANDALPKNRGYADKYPRIDMRFSIFGKIDEYNYYAEAKIIKEHDNSLERRYIVTGIDNFISRKYYDGCLIAYIMDGDLVNIVDDLNKLLIKDERSSEILVKGECKFFNKYYESHHKAIEILKHFIFDFTKSEVPRA